MVLAAAGLAMRYFYDCEFIEDGRTIDLISIGIVADDGREYYAINSDMPVDRIRKNNWLMENVWPHLTPDYCLEWKPKTQIRDEVADFLRAPDGMDTELWADYAAYDHVALAQLFGRMIDLPLHVPMFTNDLRQEWRRLGEPELPEQEIGLHNALEDARHLKRCHDHLEEMTAP